MKAKKEICYGIIPLTYRENYYEVFLVQHIKGLYWGFPKGHADAKESPKEAAERELKEETGMTVIRYLPHPYLAMQYGFKRDEQLIDKTVHFYLAEVTPKYSCQSEEIIQGRWVSLKDLSSYVTFKEEDELFQKIITLLMS
jgi:bis(5'-nucleosidyl)-tetraphosphatase